VCIAKEHEKKKDDLAIFFKKRRFSLNYRWVVEYNDLHQILDSPSPNSTVASSSSSQDHQTDNIALMIELIDQFGEEQKEKGKGILVVNTHVFWDPKYPEIKLNQVHYLKFKIAQLLSKKQFLFNSKKNQK